MEINRRYLDIKDRVFQENPDAKLIDRFEKALVGLTQNSKPHVAVYDLEKCISILIEEGILINDAMIYLDEILNSKKEENDPIFISL